MAKRKQRIPSLTTKFRFTGWQASASRLMQEYDQVQGIATAVTLRRARVVMFLGVPLHAALAFWFAQFQAPIGQPNLQDWADALTELQVDIALALLVCGVLSHILLRRNAGHSRFGMAVQTLFCGAYLAFGAAAAIQDVTIGNGIATFLVICMGTAVLSLMRPVFSGLVFVAAFLVFWIILRSTPMDATLLSSLQIQAIAVVLMAQLISVMMWHQYTRTVLLRRKLELSNQALLQKQQELEFLAERDTLTGLYNRRMFLQLAQRELDRLARVPGHVCALMVDLDFFKRINDQHGHPAGDLVLKQVAQRIAAHVRSTDILARMGGEEFIVLMPNTDRAGALKLAEKLREAVRGQPMELPALQVPITASLGVTGLQTHQQAPLETLYATADKALYAAKEQGRDRVVWSEVPLEP